MGPLASQRGQLGVGACPQVDEPHGLPSDEDPVWYGDQRAQADDSAIRLV
jgi:hypothetical protein